MERRRAVLFAVGSILAILGAIAIVFVVLARDRREKNEPLHAQVTAVATESASASTLGTPPFPIVSALPAGGAPGSSIAASIDAASAKADDAMHSADPFVQREAIEASLARKDVGALPAIEALDLTKNGYVAAAAIDAVGKLGAMAPEPARREAVRTLDRWLKQESKRKANDSIGNVSIAVDALSDTRSSDAIAPLVEALDSATQPIHIETKIVAALVSLDARTAAPSVERFAARVRARESHDDLERELAKEALSAAETALAKWRTP